MHVNLCNYVIHIKRLRNDGNMCAYRAHYTHSVIGLHFELKTSAMFVIFWNLFFYSSLHNVNKYSTLITCVYGTAFGGSNSHFWDILHIYLSSTRIWCKWTLKLLSLRLFNFFFHLVCHVSDFVCRCSFVLVSFDQKFCAYWMIHTLFLLSFFFCVSCQFDKLVHKETFVFFSALI